MTRKVKVKVTFSPKQKLEYAKLMVEGENRYYVGDITYIRHHNGWSYLACVLNLATKEIIGYALSTKPDSNNDLTLRRASKVVNIHQRSLRYISLTKK